MLEKDKMTNVSFEKLHDSGILTPIIIDGLDGSGKGTIVDEMSDSLISRGMNVLLIDLPQYEQPWGQVIKRVLHTPSIDLSLEERMLLYVFNRLETIDGIKKQTSNIYQKANAPIVLLFDRFITSNVITCAYYAKTHNQDLDIEKLYEFMIESDKYFLSELYLNEFQVVVPQLDANLAVDAIENDNTRDGRDLYENTDVQSIADRYYKELSGTQSDRPSTIEVVDQVENGKRLSAKEVAEKILDKYFKYPTMLQTPHIVGIKERLQLEAIDENAHIKIYDMLKLDKYRNLAKFDPY